MKILVKILIIALFWTTIFTVSTLAKVPVDGGGKQTLTQSQIDSFSTNAPTIGTKLNQDNSFDSITSAIYGVAAFICYGAAVIIVLVKGVKFMNAAPDAKADIKKEAITIAVGATIVFGIGVFLQIIANITITDLF